MNKSILPVITAWIVFAIALIVYTLTLEPTTSFWDCSEFISCASGLEIGHAPGAPMFMLFGRFFSMFASNPAQVAFMVNMVSAVASAFTIFFLYWTIAWFVKKWMLKSDLDYSISVKNLIIYGSAAIGALSFAFTDTFWFSAVEGEVYATSSFFSAIAFWAITKWEETPEGKTGNRWIVLIFYLLGLSVGVHLLNTLTIPAIALVYYFKKYKSSTRGILITLVISFLLILLIIFGVVPGVVSLTAYTDLLFVNSFGLPVYIGAITFIIILISVLFAINRHAEKKGKSKLKLIVLCCGIWLIGYSSFGVLVIRSISNPFVDMNNVENLFGLVNYLNREQYPQRPIVYGNNYNSPVIDYKERFTYKLYDKHYYKDKLNPDYVFNDETLTLFPRMASLEPGHEDAYQSWIKIKGRPVTITQPDGTSVEIRVPTFFDNLKFFFRYQLGYMYFRYFMWNFSGRQNDIQGHGGVLNGNWITGIPFLDKALVGPPDDTISTVDQKKSRTVYFMLPFILGMIGVFAHYKKDRGNFVVNMLLFLLTGIAIVIYLNEIPSTPRERDYAFVGSFYAFSIWIGLGCLAIIESIKKLRNNLVACSAVLTILLVSVPVLLLCQNYSSHNRSNRYTTRDYALDMLESCDKDALLFTSADNDTYPIWYMQEVEVVRPDIREILEPFISLDWYADQFNQKFEGKKELKFGYTGKQLLMDSNMYFPVLKKIDSTIELRKVLGFIKSDDIRTMVEGRNGIRYHFIPGKDITFKVNKANFLKSCSYAKLNENEIPDQIEFTVNNENLNRDEIFILDLIARNDWEKPIYFGSPNILERLGLSQYLHSEGLLYRLSPFKNGLPSDFAHDQALYQYNIIKNKFKWGNINAKNVYIDQMNIQVIGMFSFRSMFASVAKMLILTNEKEKGKEILQMGETIFPKEKIPYSQESAEIIDAYYVLGDTLKADGMAKNMCKYFDTKLAYCSKINEYFKENVTNSDAGMSIYILKKLLEVTANHKSPVKDEIAMIINKYYKE
jgi:hypothetical protein